MNVCDSRISRRPTLLGVGILMIAVGLLLGTATAWGDMDVNVMPDGLRVPGTNTAYATPGEELFVWGNVTGGTEPYTYVWSFGDGTPDDAGNVADPRNIEVPHTYAVTGTFFAALTVTDAAAEVDAAMVRIDVVLDDEARQVNRAVVKGLKWLYLNQFEDGSWDGYPPEAYTAGAVQAFEIRGHLPANDPLEDIYAATVVAGLDFICERAQIQTPLDEQIAGDPDSDGDDIGVFWSENEGSSNLAQYTGGLVMLAFAASAAPDRVATTGVASGWIYREIMEDAVDYMAWAQNEGICADSFDEWCSSDCGLFEIWRSGGGGGGGPDKASDKDAEYAQEANIVIQYYCNAESECSDGHGFIVDYGDGSAPEAIAPAYCEEGYAETGYDPYPTHAYEPGVYDACAYWDNEPFGELGPEDIEICCIHLTIVGPEGTGTPEYGRGGWRYVANTDCSSDNSVTQWPVIGLEALESPVWGLLAPAWVKEELNLWTTYSQNHDPGDLYDGAFFYSNDDTTWYTKGSSGAGLCQLGYLDAPDSDPRVQDVLAYIDRNWEDDNRGNLYSMYALAKGARISNPPVISLPTVGNWQEVYNQWLIEDQNPDGYWAGSWASDVLNTAWGIEILTQSIAELVPVAVAEAVQTSVPPNADVNFIGSGSYHQDPDSQIVAYRWDYDESDGVDMDNPDATEADPVLAGGYPETGADYSVVATLEVEDNVGRTDRDTVVVLVTSMNVAPVADPGGPYAGAAGAPIDLDASGSYDPNEEGLPGAIFNSDIGEYDHIVLYEWDFDGDGVYDSSSPDPAASHSYAAIGTYTVLLRVTDSFGASATSALRVTTVAISDLWLTAYRFGAPFPGFSTRRGTRTEWKQVEMENRGGGGARDITATIVNVPPQVTVLVGTVTFPDLPAGASAWSNETFVVRFPLYLAGSIDFSQIMWDIEFTDDLGTRHLIRNVPQFPKVAFFNWFWNLLRRWR
jgi:PKD repeat protein